MSKLKYKVIWKIFFSSDKIHKDNLSKKEANKLSEYLNKTSSDEYEWTIVLPQ